MKIDGVSLVEPSATDDPHALGPVAVVIDCDLDALAQKVRNDHHYRGWRCPSVSGKLDFCVGCGTLAPVSPAALPELVLFSASELPSPLSLLCVDTRLHSPAYTQ